MALNSIINMTQNKEKRVSPVSIDKSFFIDTHTFISLSEINKSCSDINLGLNIFNYVKTHEIDLEVVSMISNQFNRITNLRASDFKGLSKQGMKEMALENIWDGIKEAFIKMWEYIRDALTGLLNGIKNFFNSKEDEKSAKIAERLTKAFKDLDVEDYGDIVISNIPNKEQLSCRMSFYKTVLETIQKLYRDAKTNTFSPSPNEIFVKIIYDQKQIDKNGMAGIIVNEKEKKIAITKMDTHNGQIKDFLWLIDSESKIDKVQKEYLELKGKYEELQKTIQDILTISKIQINGLKSNLMTPEEKDLQHSVVAYSTLINVIGTIIPAFIKDTLVVNNVCEQIVKGLEQNKNISAGYENRTKVF